MISYSFKMIWRRRRQHFFPWLGLFLLFSICAFYVFLFHFEFLPYFSDLGWSHKNIATVDIPWNTKDSLSHTNESLCYEIGQMLQVENVCQTFSFAPGSFMANEIFARSIGDDKNKAVGFRIGRVDSTFLDVVPLKGLKGRWLSKEDRYKKVIPAVISERLLEWMGESKPYLDKRLKILAKGKDTLEIQVVGTIPFFRKSVYSSKQEVVFLPVEKKSYTYMIRLKEGVDLPAFQRDLEQVTLRNLPPSALDNMRVDFLETVFQNYYKNERPAIIATASIVLLVLINAIVGLVALFWEKARKRAHELALRRAVGAPRKTIFREVYGEALVLTLLAIIPGLALTFQIPFLVNQEWEMWIYSSLEAVTFILFVVFWCSYFPARKASRILPAQALMEE